MTVRAQGPDTFSADSTDIRLHKPGVAGSSPAAATCEEKGQAQIDHAPAAEYHRRPETSCSQLKELAESPLAFYLRYISGEAPPKSSSALEYGTLLHLWGELGEEKFWELALEYPAKTLTATGLVGKEAKAWAETQPAGSVIITPSDRQKLWAQTRQILANTAARSLLEEAVDHEFNVTFNWLGHDCRCRGDGATPDHWWDLKTTSEVNPAKTFFRAVERYNYDLQSAFYGEASTQLGWKPHAMRFIATSSVWPHLCTVVYLPAELQELGRRRCLKLLSELQQRREWDSWMPPDYGEVREMECPAWMLKGVEE